MKVLRLVAALLAALAALPTPAGPDDRARVTALADRYVAEYQKYFPLSYAFSGLPVERHDGIDINSAADIARWHALMKVDGGRARGDQPRRLRRPNRSGSPGSSSTRHSGRTG